MTLQELVQLTDDSSSGQVNPAVVNAALEEASGKVDAYARSRYLTPLQNGDSVKGITLDIAVYLLFSRRRSFKISETVQKRYDDAIAFLKDISAGRAQFDEPQGDLPNNSAAGPVVTASKTDSGVPHDADLRFTDRKVGGYW